MAGALSLRGDILALVDKNRDAALPEDLLARLAEEARLMGIGEQIRCDSSSKRAWWRWRRNR